MTEPTPPTQRPEKGQGPWCTEDLEKWWVVADSPADALREAESIADPLFPDYFGWKVTIEPVLIAWSEEYNGHEVEIEEQPYETEATVQAWRIMVEDR